MRLTLQGYYCLSRDTGHASNEGQAVKKGGRVGEWQDLGQKASVICRIYGGIKAKKSGEFGPLINDPQFPSFSFLDFFLGPPTWTLLSVDISNGND